MEVEQVHRELVQASRLGGMAEIATNVLHNVGNVLNSVNVSTSLIVQGVKKSRAANLDRVVALLKDTRMTLEVFLPMIRGANNCRFIWRSLPNSSAPISTK